MANHRATPFVMAKGLPPPLGEGDELHLRILPKTPLPALRCPRTAAIQTDAMPAAAISPLETQSGGIAHVRIGDHLLDIYAQQGATVVHIPALGILCGGSWERPDGQFSWPTAATAARNWIRCASLAHSARPACSSSSRM